MGGEIKPVPGFRNRYAARDGTLFGMSGRPLALQLDKHGYLSVKSLTTRGKLRWEYAHRMVASAWIDNPLGLEQVNHLNKVRHDNTVDNLEWCSPRSNSKHANGGGAGRLAKLSNEDALDIRSRYVLGESLSGIAKMYCVKADAISSVVHWRTFDYPCP